MYICHPKNFMEMKYLFFATILAISLGASGQTLNTPADTALNTTAISTAPDSYNKTKTFQFFDDTTPNQIIQVDAVVWNGTQDAGFFYVRDIAGIRDTGIVAILSNNGLANADIVVGGGGDTVLVVYQTLTRIDWQTFGWNGSTYSHLATATLSTAVPNYIYGTPRVDFHEETGDVVAAYMSYATSPTNEAFAISGDIQGNWKSVANDNGFGAFRVSDNAGLSNNKTRGPAGVNIYHHITQGTLVHFTYTSQTAAGLTELWHFSVPDINNLTDNNLDSLVHNERLVQGADSTIKVGWSDIDSWGNSNPTIMGFDYRDLWTVAVPVKDLAADNSQILTLSGKGGGSSIVAQNYTAGNLDSCLNNNVGVAYGKDFVAVVWDHTDCDSNGNLSGQDILGALQAVDLTGPIKHFWLNNDTAGNQLTPSIAGSMADCLPFGYRSVANNTIYYGEFCNQKSMALDGVEILKGLKIFPNPSTTGWLTVENFEDGNFNAKVLDNQGKTVKEINIHQGQTEFNLSDLRKGLYFLQSEQGHFAKFLLQ